MPDLRDLSIRFYKEVFDNGNVDLIDEMLTPDFVEHQKFPGLSNDREGVKRFFVEMRRSFPDLSVTVEDILVEGDRVATRVTFHGTHRGDFLGIPPTGRRLSVAGMDWTRFENGKIAEHWGVTDQVSMMEQLGLMPPSEGSG